ncbi:glutaminase [Microbacterium hominis]|uniref:glutaminase n=1 Tax=Microbacterium TaxID=33882 RepID=UPI00168BD740|nr:MULTISPECIES: glutaminase [Microbacterium]QOC26529.1 glutaminase [Microbacterium hominis]QOC27702.1 glutaminase [Microbacterium hominis]QYF97163.1 glutaminase [Microbacterium sp. PAMC21962]
MTVPSASGADVPVGPGLLDAILDDARRRLAGTPKERLGDWAHARRLLGFGRAPRIVPVGEAWHVGVLLIGDADLFATGEVLRARTEAIRGYTAEAQRARSERAAAAARGGFADGEVLHLGATAIDLDAVRRGEASGPLALVDGIPLVTWTPAGARRPLADYLDDQLSLR